MANAILVMNSCYGQVLGKNSNRLPGEVQELMHQPGADGITGDLKCTYITVPAVSKTYSVILSKPAILWGCEMGANDQGVVGATIQVHDKSSDGLIPQDIVRLCLERSGSLEEVLTILDSLLCDFGNDSIEGGFVFLDKDSVLYVETKGKAWVAQIFTEGVHFLPPSGPITDNYSKSSGNLEELAKGLGWNGEGKISWNEVFLNGSRSLNGKRQETEESILTTYLKDLDNFNVEKMTQLLRDSENRICRTSSDLTPTAASQVSILPKSGPACHWFTATPDPTLSVFKPFIFTPNARIGNYTTSSPDGQHILYSLHAKATSSGENKMLTLLKEMEKNCFNEVDTFLFDENAGKSLSEVDDLFKDCVEAEMKFYK